MLTRMEVGIDEAPRGSCPQKARQRQEHHLNAGMYWSKCDRRFKHNVYPLMTSKSNGSLKKDNAGT